MLKAIPSTLLGSEPILLSVAIKIEITVHIEYETNESVFHKCFSPCESFASVARFSLGWHLRNTPRDQNRRFATSWPWRGAPYNAVGLMYPKPDSKPVAPDTVVCRALVAVGFPS